MVRNRQLTELVRDVAAARRRRRARARSSGTATRCTRCSTDLQFRVLRERLFASVAAAEPEAEEGFDVVRHPARPRRGDASGWTSTPAAARRVGAGLPRHLGPRDRLAVPASRWPRPTAPPPTSTPEAHERRTTTRRSPPGWPTRRRPRRPTTSRDRCSRCASTAGRSPASPTTPSSPPTCCGPTSAPSTWPISRCATCTASCAATSRSPGSSPSTAASTNPTTRSPRPRPCAPARSATWPTRYDPELERSGAARLLTEMELPLTFVLADMEAVGIAADTDALLSLQAELGAGVKAVEQDAHELVGREFNLGSPKQLQEILFDQFGLPKTKRIKTGYTTDADSLADLYVQDRAPGARAAAAAPRGRPAQDGRRRAAAAHRRPRPHPHDVQPDHRRHRTAVVHRPEPAEHPGAHRRRAPHPRGVHGRRGLRVADDRRLQPDRDADHGAPVRRRGAASRRSCPARTCTPSSRPGRSACPPQTIDRRAAPSGQGDVLRAGVRAVAVRAVPPAQDHPGRGARADGRLLHPVRRRARLPALGRRGGPADRASPRRSWAGAATWTS